MKIKIQIYVYFITNLDMFMLDVLTFYHKLVNLFLINLQHILEATIHLICHKFVKIKIQICEYFITNVDIFILDL